MVNRRGNDFRNADGRTDDVVGGGDVDGSGGNDVVVVGGGGCVVVGVLGVVWCHYVR